MNDRDRFIRAIEADPEDDAVRLVFADWLEENGDPDRAQFIRLQVEHYRLTGSGKWGKLAEEIALLERHGTLVSEALKAEVAARCERAAGG